MKNKISLFLALAAASFANSAHADIFYGSSSNGIEDFELGVLSDNGPEAFLPASYEGFAASRNGVATENTPFAIRAGDPAGPYAYVDPCLTFRGPKSPKNHFFLANEVRVSLKVKELAF